MKTWILLLLILSVNFRLFAGNNEVLVISEGFSDTLLSRQVRYITTDQLKKDSFKSPGIWKPYFRNTIRFGGHNPPMWLFFEVSTKTSRTSSYILDVFYPGMDGADLVVQEHGGITQTIAGVQRRQFLEQRSIPGNKLLFRISLKPGRLYSIYTRTPRTYDRHLVGLHLWTEQKFQASNLIQQIVFFVLTGGLLLGVLLSALLFFLLWESIFWQYSLYILSLALVILVLAGYLDPYILSLSILLFDHTSALFIFLSIGVHVTLSFHYLSVKAFAPPWLQYIGKGIIISAFASIFPFFLDTPALHTLVGGFCYYLLIIAELYIFANILRGLFRRHVPSMIYFVRFVPFLFGLPLLLSLPVLTHVYQSVELLLIAAVFEVFFLASGIAYSYFETRKAKGALAIRLTETQAQVIQTQELERRRIAADLHDDLGGTLATIRRKITDIRLNLTDLKAAQEFDNLEPLIKKSNEDLRRIAHNLMPPEFERIGLTDSLRQLIRDIPQQPTRFSFQTSGPARKLCLDTELNIYRIVSELIQNILKHACAERATVQLLYFSDHLMIMVDDDGKGFDTQDRQPATSGIGVKNSMLRAEYIGASLRRESSTAGTLIVIEIPYTI